jgi:VWFA-related protein
VSSRFISLMLVAFVLLFIATSNPTAQDNKTASVQAPTARPTPTPSDEQEPVKVFTEEVRLPVSAQDGQGRFDPTLDVNDLIVFEDGMQQEIKSVQRIPASVLLLLGTGGEMNPVMRVSTTRDTALNLIASLHAGDQMAALQFGARVEVLQAWTEDEKDLMHALKTKLYSTKGTRLADAISAASAFFINQPLGNRHLVLITDGVEMPSARAGYEEALKVLTAGDAKSKAEMDAAIKRLLAAQASLHVISYTEFARLAFKGKLKKYRGSNAPPGSVLASGIQNAGIDPTLPPTMHRGRTSDPAYGDGINFDPQMRKLRKAYEKAMKKSEQQLTSLADETGARILKPESAEEMIVQGAEVARDIGSQYVITYVPKRPLAEARPGEYRRLQVASRRAGVTVRTRRGYVAAPTP